MNGNSYNLRIIDYNHDDKVSGGKAGITFEMQHCYGITAADRYSMNLTNINLGSWENLYMRQTVIPIMKSYLPSDLQAVIKPVNKLMTAGENSSTIIITADDLWRLSEVELYGTPLNYALEGEGMHYTYYLLNNPISAKIKQQAGENYSRCARSPTKLSAADFFFISATGSKSYGDSTLKFGVSFGSCV